MTIMQFDLKKYFLVTRMELSLHQHFWAELNHVIIDKILFYKNKSCNIPPSLSRSKSLSQVRLVHSCYPNIFEKLSRRGVGLWRSVYRTYVKLEENVFSEVKHIWRAAHIASFFVSFIHFTSYTHQESLSLTNAR